MQRKQKHTKLTKEKMRLSALNRDNSNRIKALPKGNRHWRWSDKPNILTFHKRIHRKFGKASLNKCTKCPKQARDWALIGKRYSDQRKDYTPLCRKCHVNLDNSWLKRTVVITKRNLKGQIVKTKSYERH